MFFLSRSGWERSGVWRARARSSSASDGLLLSGSFSEESFSRVAGSSFKAASKSARAFVDAVARTSVAFGGAVGRIEGVGAGSGSGGWADGGATNSAFGARSSILATEEAGAGLLPHLTLPARTSW